MIGITRESGQQKDFFVTIATKKRVAQLGQELSTRIGVDFVPIE